MRLLNTYFVFFLLPVVFSLPIERLKQQLANANGLEGLSALERCNRGFPTLVEVKEPAAFDRPAYEPCETDSQCSDGLKCLCQSSGGKECALPYCLTPGGDKVPNDGQYHDINCQLHCICDGSDVGCTPLCENGLGAHCDGGAAYRLNAVPDPNGGCCPSYACDGPWVVLSPEGSNPYWYKLQSASHGEWLAYDPANPVDNDPFHGDGNSANGVIFKVVPVNEANQHDTWLQFDTDFYLVSPAGTYIERGVRMNNDDCNGGTPHNSCRYGLTYAAAPSQTWRTPKPDTGRGAFVPENGQIGIEIGGTGEDIYKPDNNRRRYITLRYDVSVVVWWWQVDEYVKFVPA